jgi:thiol-disulfide isomerase/thioredoxin
VSEQLVIVAVFAVAVLLLGLASRWIARRRALAQVGQPLPPSLRGQLPTGSRSLLYFFGPHCASCRLQAQVVDDLEARGVTALRINAAEEPDLAGWFGVLTVPSTVIVGEDQSVQQFLPGFQPITTLEASLQPGDSLS